MEKGFVSDTENFSYALICGAVKGELSGIVDRMPGSKILEVGGRKMVSGVLGGIDVRLLETGPGMANAVQAITAAIEARRPSLILQIGCGGVFEPSGMKIGDVAAAEMEIDVHLGVEASDPAVFIDPLPFPVISKPDQAILNRYPLNSKLVDSACKAMKAEFKDNKAGVFKGPFVTVSTITATDLRAQKLFEAFCPCMENMEGAGAAHAASHYNIPFVEIRSASNRVGKRDRGAWNLALAFQNASRAAAAALPAVIACLTEKDDSDD